jgi:glutathione peroxidase-family protein
MFRLQTLVAFLMLLASSRAFVSNPGMRLARQLSLSMSSFYDITEKNAKGDAVSFASFKGKVVYGVNVASKCGYTSSGYDLLKKLSAKEGVEVALFPCNQFGAQEPGSDAEVASFCALKGVEGANVFTKGDVNGPNTRPTYKFLKEKGILGDVAWNFAVRCLSSLSPPSLRWGD